MPSVRKAVSELSRAIARLAPPVSPKRRKLSVCAPRKRSGMKRSSVSPMASAAVQPNILSAASLKRTMRCSSSTVMIASIAEETMPVSRSLLSRSACSIRIKSSMSVSEPAQRTIRPSASRPGCARLRNQR